MRRAWTPEFSLNFLILPPILFLVPTFFIPLGVVIYRSINGTDFSFGNYAWVFSNPTVLIVLGQTFKTAIYSTIIALLVGFPIAHMISQARTFWANIAFACVLIPLWTSIVTRTYAWMALLGRRGLVNQMLIDAGLIERPLSLMYNSFAVQVGMVQVLLPMMILPILSTMRQLDQTKLMAARILGANPIRVFVHIYVPMCLPGILAGSVLVFITALGFYVTPALLGGDKNMMIAVLIEQQVTKSLNWPVASALATILLVFVLIFLWIVSAIAKLRGVKLEAA